MRQVVNPRYTKQKDLYSCACVSILNAYKFFGHQVSLSSHLPLLKIELGTKPRQGTSHEASRDLIPQLFKGRSRYQPRLEEIDTHLEKDYPVLHNVCTYKDLGHFYLIVGKTAKYYKVVNFFDYRNVPFALQRISRKKLLKYNRKTYNQIGSWAYFPTQVKREDLSHG